VVSIQSLDAKCLSLATFLFPNSFVNYMVNDDRAFSGASIQCPALYEKQKRVGDRVLLKSFRHYSYLPGVCYTSLVATRMCSGSKAFILNTKDQHKVTGMFLHVPDTSQICSFFHYWSVGSTTFNNFTY